MMDLETIKILDKQELMRIVSQSGYVEIAEILAKLDLNGSELLDATDFQAIKWKITLLQRKQLLFFIKQLKINPSILHKIAPTVAPKPKSQHSQLILPVKKTFQPMPPNFSSDQKETKSRLPDITTSVGRNKGFANQLEKVLGGTNKTVNKLLPTSIYPLQEMTHQRQGNVTTRKLPLPLPVENHGNQEQDEFYINLPTQPKHSTYGYPNEIVEDNVEDTYENVKNTFDSGRKSSSDRNIAQQQNSSQPGNGGSDDDFYELPPPPPPSSRFVPSKQMNISAFLRREKVNQPPALKPEDSYEPPPRLNLTKNPSVIRSLSISSQSKWESPQKLPIVQSPEEEDEEDNYEVPNEHNGPRKNFAPPVAPTKRSIVQSKSPLQDQEEEEDDYEPAPTCLVLGRSKTSVSPVANRKPIPTPTRNDSPSGRTEVNKQKGTNGYLSLLSPQKDKPSSTIDSPFSSDQKRANNVASAFDNTVGKNRIEMNYENHMMKSENSSFRKLKMNPLLNRPLPEIPKIAEPKASTIKVPMDYRRQISSSSTNSNHSTFEKSAGYVELTKNLNMNYESKSHVDDDDDQIYQNNQPNALNEPDEEPTEYENLAPLNSPQHQKLDGRNQQLRNEFSKNSIQNSLVQQLTSELTARKKVQNQPIDLGNNLPAYGNTFDPPRRITSQKKNMIRGDVEALPTFKSRKNDFPDVPVKRPISSLPKPPAHFNPTSYITEPSDVDEDFEESDDEGVGNIFNINNEPYFRNTDRKGAKSLLRKLEDGAFLFRPSQHYFLVLTIKYNNKFYNLGIERTKNDKIKLNSDNESVPPEFSSLRDFVDHFTNEAVTFQVGDQLLETFLKPVLPPDLF